jgi:Copper transport outer membrane protein, MctB
VIDFRYHLVSLVAVFLAVALGIVIGTTALNQPILSDIKSQVTKLEADKRTLEDQTRQLTSQVHSDDAFDSAVAPALVGGTLSGRKVLLVVASDGLDSDVVDGLSTMVRTAGGAVAGVIRLQDGYADPAKAATIQAYVTGPGRPAGVTLPETDDAGQLVAALLADVLMVPNQGSVSAGDTAAISTVLAGLSALNVVAQDSSSVTPADYAVVLTSGQRTDKDAAQRNATVVALAAALDAGGAGAVVAGDIDSAGANGLVGVLRDNPTVSATVSTVDNVPTAAGQISTVLALSRERQGTSGKYGTGSDTQPAPPVPGSGQ